MEPNEIASIQPFLTYKRGKLMLFGLTVGGVQSVLNQLQYAVLFQTQKSVTSRSLATIVF